MVDDVAKCYNNKKRLETFLMFVGNVKNAENVIKMKMSAVKVKVKKG